MENFYTSAYLFEKNAYPGVIITEIMVIGTCVFVYLGPAEKGTNANGSIFSMFSGENLSGRNSCKKTLCNDWISGSWFIYEWAREHFKQEHLKIQPAQDTF